jgi:hypothetical protein
LLLNKKLIFSGLLFSILFFTSCSKEYEPPPHHLFEDENLVIKTAREVLNDKVSFTTSGHFESDTVKSIIAGVEASEQNEWGIRFHLISWVDGEFQKVYSTGLLEGTFIQCIVDKLKLTDTENELIYYNSEGYFMGTGGGDVFSYIMDFKKKQIYSAELTVVSRGRASLELSANIENPMIKTFFVSYFRREYQNLRVAEPSK